MADSVDDLTVKTEKLAIDVNSDKNWCDMPPEIKLECIKVMDFKMRFCLRSTSKTERALVDSQRYSLNKLSVFSDYGLIIWDKSENKYDRVENAAVSVLVHILKTCDIKQFLYCCKCEPEQSDTDVLDHLIAPESIRVKRFNYYLETNSDFNEKIIFFLKKCWKNIELIEFESFGGKIPFKELISIPSVTHAKVLRIFSHWYSPLEVPWLAEKWIENDVKVGTILQMYYHRGQVTDELPVREFLNRVISKPNEIIRMRTFNPAKHILMVYKDEGGNYFYGPSLVSVVIPSNLKESEYDEYTKLASV